MASGSLSMKRRTKQLVNPLSLKPKLVSSYDRLQRSLYRFRTFRAIWVDGGRSRGVRKTHPIVIKIKLVLILVAGLHHMKFYCHRECLEKVVWVQTQWLLSPKMWKYHGDPGPRTKQPKVKQSCFFRLWAFYASMTAQNVSKYIPKVSMMTTDDFYEKNNDPNICLK